ncbi:MAG: flagellar motor switch protein FliG [Gammaproteobacteria bacterium]|nr:MAG: flagellar motor switch protein FliG [Gammaproteobacteria bacterium]
MANAEAAAIPGVERAAILLMSMGENEAAQVLKHMEPKEVQKIGLAMAGLQNVSKSKASTVLRNFISTVQNETALGIGAQDYVKSMLINALGEDKAGSVLDRILHGANTKGLDTLKWMDPRAVSELIRIEHPQIISIVLAYLESEQAADVLALLPDDIRFDVMMRIATLDGIQPSALNELNEILEKQFTGSTNVASSSVGGIKTAANILNFMETSTESEIIEKVRESDSGLAERIEELMFVFEDLVTVDDKGIQALLREVSSESLVVAMKGASEGIKEKIFNNMSKRASEMLRDDLEVKGPVRLSEVEAAQKEILSTARKMADAGDIALGGKGGEEFV